jgi:hypothetical protein
MRPEHKGHAMNIQEQEEIDYQIGCASELQNALVWSRMNRRPDDSRRIEDAVKAGRFVIVLEMTEYCPSTDAIMGSIRLALSTHDTREHAIAAMTGEEPTNEFNIYILPRLKNLATPVQTTDNNEIPF